MQLGAKKPVQDSSLLASHLVTRINTPKYGGPVGRGLRQLRHALVEV